MLDASQVKLRELYLKTARRVQFHPRFSRRDLRKVQILGRNFRPCGLSEVEGQGQNGNQAVYRSNGTGGSQFTY